MGFELVYGFGKLCRLSFVFGLDRGEFFIEVALGLPQALDRFFERGYLLAEGCFVLDVLTTDLAQMLEFLEVLPDGVLMFLVAGGGRFDFGVECADLFGQPVAFRLEPGDGFVLLFDGQLGRLEVGEPLVGLMLRPAAGRLNFAVQRFDGCGQ